MPRMSQVRVFQLGLAFLCAVALLGSNGSRAWGAQARGPRTPPDDFPTGPAIGERLPEFELRNQRGEMVDFHVDRAGSRAVVMFQRSVVW